MLCTQIHINYHAQFHGIFSTEFILAGAIIYILLLFARGQSVSFSLIIAFGAATLNSKVAP
jgi:hypothetical protein